MSFILLPSNLLITFWTISVLLFVAKPSSAFMRWATLSFSMVFLIVLWSPLSQWVSSPLERAFPQHTRLESKTLRYIVHLSGAERPSRARHRQDMHLSDQFGRYLEVLRLSKLYPDTPILFSGGHITQQTSDLEIGASVYEALGLKQRVIFLGGAKDTCDNAKEVSAYLEAANDSGPLLLVTSAMHMPRSVLCFEAYNQQVIPAPAAPISTIAGSFKAWIKHPLNTSKLRHLDLAMHEWLGLAGYRITGRIKKLWPNTQIEQIAKPGSKKSPG